MSSNYTRRGFLGGCAQVAGAVALNGCYGPRTENTVSQTQTTSVFDGVKIGAITYSFRNMPKYPFAMVDYAKRAGIGSLELMSADLERDLGFVPPFKIPRGDKEAEKRYIAFRREWRRSIREADFIRVREKYETSGVSIHALLFQEIAVADDETADYIFNAAKSIGATAVSRQVFLEGAPGYSEILSRMARHADRHSFSIMFHTHEKVGLTTFDGPILGFSENFRINFDVGNYVAGGHGDPVDFMKKYHDRIETVHLKECLAKDSAGGIRNVHGGTARPWGEGNVPFRRIFDYMKGIRAGYYADIEAEHKIPPGSNDVLEVRKCVQYAERIIKG
jgi:sugar phosphate isomerase/epimerase